MSDTTVVKADKEPLPTKGPDGGKRESKWNSLEIVKLMVSSSVPVLLFIFGSEISQKQTQQAKLQAEAERRQAEEKSKVDQAVRKRLELWDKIAIPLNDTYCYFLCVGNWKELNATNVIARKRLIDQTIYAYRPFFSDQFYETYEQFANACFEGYHKLSEEPRLRTRPRRPADFSAGTNRFTYAENEGQIHYNYYQLLNFMSKELNLPATSMPSVPNEPAETNSVFVYDLRIHFHTREEGKRSDTVVSVFLESDDGTEFASAAAAGTYREDSDQSLELTPRQPMLASDLNKLKIVIRIAPRGRDSWTFNYLLQGSIHGEPDFTVQAKGCRLTQDAPERTDYLKNLKP